MDEVVAHLTAVCQLLARGEAPASLAPQLAGASLHALPKPSGGVRPIAVGESLRRLVGKLLRQAVKTDVRSGLWPLQIGVAALVALNVAYMSCEIGHTATLATLTKLSFDWIFGTHSTWSTGRLCFALCGRTSPV